MALRQAAIADGWTEERPREAGYYWLYHDGMPTEAVRVTYTEGDEWPYVHFYHDARPLRIDDLHEGCVWRRIEPPKYKGGPL